MDEIKPINKLFVERYHLIEIGITFALGLVFGVLIGVLTLMSFAR